ncbi:MAG: TolC family protein [Verrucomicrobiae bacterium]|nr:TolC family protein [Verrucomicrobiae bacterium]
MKFPTSLGLVSLALGTAALGAPNSVQSISLEECLQRAFQDNLEIQIIRYSPELAELNLMGSYGAYDPNFSFSYGANRSQQPAQLGVGQVPIPGNVSWSQNGSLGLSGLLPTGADYRLFGNLLSQRSFFNEQYQAFAPASAGIQVSQPLLRDFWIDSARWAIALNKKTILQEEQSIRAQLITTAADVQLAYYDLAAAVKGIEVQRQAVELAERLLMENRKRVEVGALAPLEEKQAEAQVAQSRADLISAQQVFNVAQNTLKRLMTSDYSEIVETTFQPSDSFRPHPYPFNRQESWSRGLTLRPDVVQLQVELEKQNVTLRFRRNQLFPTLDLTSSFGVQAQNQVGGTNYYRRDGIVGQSLNDIANVEYKNYGIGAVLNFPLGNRSARSSYRAAKVERERLILQYKQLEQSIMVALDNEILAAQTSYERVGATRQARIYAEAALDAEQKKLENGKSTTFEVLRLQRDLTTASRDEVRAVADYFRAMSVLFRDEGSTLDRLGVRITTN